MAVAVMAIPWTLGTGVGAIGDPLEQGDFESGDSAWTKFGQGAVGCSHARTSVGAISGSWSFRLIDDHTVSSCGIFQDVQAVTGDPYYVDVKVNVTSGVIQLYLEWLNANGGRVSILVDTSSGTGLQPLAVGGAAPVGAVVGRVWLYTPMAHRGNTLIDDIRLTGQPNRLPTACFTQSPLPGLALRFESCSTDPDGDALVSMWDFGDGATGQGDVVVHSFPCPGGTFQVVLTVTDGLTGYATAADSVTLADADVDLDGLPVCREALQSTSDNDRDTDDDALSDLVESRWWPLRQAVFCQRATCPTADERLPDPIHKDVYVELDHMGADHLPDADDLDRIVDVFARMGIGNPDGYPGIRIHLDAGSARGERYDIGGGESIPHVDHVGASDGDCDDYDWGAFDAIKEDHFDPTRARVFHYAVWAHLQEDGCPESSGRSRGIGASDLIITLGGFRRHGSDDERVGTFIHELGHNFGLQHGGHDGTNHKPNYLSVMNYRYQMTGVPMADGSDHFGYSSFTAPTLDETALDERAGLGPGASAWRMTWTCGARFFPPALAYTEDGPASGPVDWDCDGAIEDAPVGGDINHDTDDPNPYAICAPIATSDCGRLEGSDDLARLQFAGGWVGAPYDDPLPPLPTATSEAPEMTPKIAAGAG